MAGFGEEKRGWDVLMVDASGVVGKVSKWGDGKRRKKKKCNCAWDFCWA